MTDRKEYYKKYNAEHKERRDQYAIEYYQKNKDEILAKHKKYREDNIEKRKAHGSEKVVCVVCGACVCRSAIAKHKRSKTCMNHKA